MTRPPMEATQSNSQPARVPAMFRLASERPASGIVRTKRGAVRRHRVALGTGTRGTRRYTRTSRYAPFWAAGSNSVGHEVIAAHGTTTAPAAIVAAVRHAGITRYGRDWRASVSCARRSGILSRS